MSRAAWWAVLLTATTAVVLLGWHAAGRPARSADLAADRGAGPAVTVAAIARTAPDPVGLTVPALGLDVLLGGLHTDRGGALQVDPDPSVAGWYVDGPAPGDLGPAVLAGHLNSRAGAGVFAGLDRVHRGDLIEVGRIDGTTATFAVTKVATYAKRDFPTAEVYGAAGRPTLRIITCGGPYDRDTGRYRSNTIVFADLLPG